MKTILINGEKVKVNRIRIGKDKVLVTEAFYTRNNAEYSALYNGLQTLCASCGATFSISNGDWIVTKLYVPRPEEIVKELVNAQ